ncbi:MAG: DNA-directed RNA polymerase subunit omega [Lachnospiraceae bacterium]|jgi:DNA-directed RNA polymerase subunit omega|nr:DNA-directed RNA polymerase subunit omega [Lachnospiraceae bacterium]
MLHPSYSDLMKVVNEEAEGEEKVVNSRYSIVMATAKRARQIVDENKANGDGELKQKPLSTAIDELEHGDVKILSAEEERSDEDDF